MIELPYWLFYTLSALAAMEVIDMAYSIKEKYWRK